MPPNPITWPWPALALALAAALVLASYLLGSIPTAWLLTRRRLGADIRQLGDGNVGAENAARLLGRQAGISVAAVDVGKGLAAILLTRLLTAAVSGSDPGSSFPSMPALTGLPLLLALLTGIAAVLGHCWPVWLRGSGGRGAATAAGALLALIPGAALPAAGPALAVSYFTRSSTRCLAVFFIGAVGLAAVYSGFQVLGYTWLLTGSALLPPTLAAAMHLQRKHRPRTPGT